MVTLFAFAIKSFLIGVGCYSTARYVWSKVYEDPEERAIKKQRLLDRFVQVPKKPQTPPKKRSTPKPKTPKAPKAQMPKPAEKQKDNPTASETK